MYMAADVPAAAGFKRRISAGRPGSCAWTGGQAALVLLLRRRVAESTPPHSCHPKRDRESGDHAAQRPGRILGDLEPGLLPSAARAASIREMELIIATQAAGETTETRRVPDVPAAQEIVKGLVAGTRWALYEKRHTRWRVRRAGRTGLDTAGCL
jgi:hypothetical protein